MMRQFSRAQQCCPYLRQPAPDDVDTCPVLTVILVFLKVDMTPKYLSPEICHWFRNPRDLVSRATSWMDPILQQNPNHRTNAGHEGSENQTQLLIIDTNLSTEKYLISTKEFHARMELEVAEVKEGKEWHDSSDKIMIQNGDPNDEPTKRDVDDPIVDGNPAKKLKRSKRDIKTLELDSSETKTKPSPKKPKKKNDDFDDMAWICAECKEADCMIQPSAHEFIFCDGKCNRIFHYPCAGLSELPKSDEDWICKDCTNQQHQCAFCHEYGKDDEDVFLCRKPGCGLFFHESCLAMHDVEVTMVKKDNHTNGEVEVDTGDAGGSEAKSTPMFTCPAHFCWTCTQKDAREKEENESCKISNSKKKKRKKQSIFQCKTETRVFVSSPY